MKILTMKVFAPPLPYIANPNIRMRQMGTRSQTLILFVLFQCVKAENQKTCFLRKPINRPGTRENEHVRTIAMMMKRRKNRKWKKLAMIRWRTLQTFVKHILLQVSRRPPLTVSLVDKYSVLTLGIVTRFCDAVLKCSFASRFCKWVLQVGFATGFCKLDLQLGSVSRFCNWDLQVGFATGFCKSVLQFGFASRFCNSVLQLGSASRFCSVVLHVGFTSRFCS